MKSSWIILVLFACAACDLFGDIEPIFETYFVKFHGGSGDQIGEGLIRLDDGGYMIVGTTFPLGQDVQNQANILVIRTDAFGNQVWQKQFGDSLHNEGVAIVQGQTTNEFVVAGNEIADDGNSRVVWFGIDEDGNLDVAGYTYFPALQNGANYKCTNLNTVTDGYFITGETNDGSLRENGGLVAPETTNDALTLLLSPNLVLADPVVSIKHGHGRTNLNELGEVVVQQGNKFVVLGQGDREPSSLDYPNGKNYWLNEFGFTSTGGIRDEDGTDSVDMINSAKFFNEKIYALGTIELGNQSQLALVLASTLEAGVMRFASQAPISTTQSLSGESISIERQDEVVILATETDQDQVVYLIKSTISGEVLWTKKFGAPGQENKGGSVLQDPDGSIVFVGTNHFLSDTKKIMLVKTNRNGEVNFE